MKTARLSYIKYFSAAVVLAFSLAARGQTTYTWTNLISGSWAATTNWQGGTVASGTGNTADFSELTLTGPKAVTLDGARTIGNLIFGDQGNAYGWALTTGSGGPLTLAVSSGTPTITVNNLGATNAEVLTGTAGMTKNGTGTLVLSGANTYTGTTTVNAGNLLLGYNSGGSGTLYSPTVTVNNGANVIETVANAMGYSGSAWVRTLNLFGGTITNQSGDSSWGLTINMMGGIMGTNGSGHFSVGDGTVVNTFATNIPSIIAGNFNLRDSGNSCTFTVASNGVSPADLVVFGNMVSQQSGSGITKTGPGVMAITRYGSVYNGQTFVNGGILQLAASSGGNGCIPDSPITVNPGGELDCNASDAMGYSISLAVTNAGLIKKINAQSETLNRPMTFSNGVLTSTSYDSVGSSFNFFGNYIQTLAGTTNLITGAGHFNLRTASCYFNVAANSTMTIACTISNYGTVTAPLSKTGAGLLVLSGTNTYIGPTSVTNGTLLVTGTGTTGSGAVTIYNGATLEGSGTVQGATTILSGGTLLVGTNVGTGVFSISNSLTLSSGGTNIMRISKTGGTASSDLLQGMSAVTYGGTLVVTNVTADSTLLAAGDTFQLFNAASYGGGFATLVLPALPFPMGWNTSQLTVNGTISIISGTTPPALNPPGGGYVGPVSVTITGPAGSLIVYTTDGSDPATSPTAVTAGSTVSGITIPVDTTETIEALATNATTGASPEVSATYTTVATGVWTNDASGGWSVPGNWLADAVPNAAGVTADFSQLTLSSNLVVTIASSETAGTLLFEDQGDTFGWSLTGGTLNLNAGSSVPSMIISNGGLNIATALASTNGLIINGEGLGTAILNSLNNSFTNLMLSGVSVTNNTASASTSATFDLGAKVAASTITVNSNSLLTFAINNVFGGSAMSATNLPTLVIDGEMYSTRYNAMPSIVLNGGTLDQDSSDGGTYFGYEFLGSITVGGSAASLISSDNGKPDHLLGTGTIFNVASTGAGVPDLTVSCALTNASGDYGNSPGILIKTGAGTMALTAFNVYSGATIVSNGTLQVASGGAIANGPVTVAGGTLEVDGQTGTGAVTVNSGGTLDGTGELGGLLTLNGGTLTAGTVSNTGTLYLQGSPSLAGGTTVLRINKTGGSIVDDEIGGASALTYGGTLTVTNITSDGTALASGDSFSLFNAGGYSGQFATLNLPALPSGLFWDTSGLTINGSIAVTATAPTPVFSPTPGGYVGTLTVKIASEPGSEIWYTTDGTDPNGSPTVMSNTSPATVVIPVNTQNETIIAFATLGGVPGSENSGTFSTIATPTWINSGGGNWSSQGNWLYGVVANGTGETADFSTLTLGGDATVYLDIAPTVGNLLFADQGDTYNWWVAPGNASSLNLAASSGTPTITVENDNVIMEASLTGTNGLDVAGAGNLILTNFNPYSGNTFVSGNLTLATNSTGEGTINGAITVNPGGSVTCIVPNALGYTNATTPRVLWVQTLNLLGGTLTTTANGDQGFGLTINLMGGTLASSGTGSRFAAGGGTVVNTIATNVTAVIAGTFNARENNPSNQIPFNVASSGGAASPDLLVSATIANATAGVGIVKNGPGVMALGAANTFSGGTIVSNGVLQMTGGGGSNGTLSNSPVTVEIGAELQAFTPDGLGSTYNAVRTLTLNGGTLREINTNSETLSRPIAMVNGTITANPGAGLTAGGAILAQGSQGDCFNLYNSTAIVYSAPATTNYITLPAGCTLALRGGSFSNAAGAYLIVDGVLNGWGGSSAYPLTFNGPGTMILNSNNTYTGSTVINSGNLEVDGSIAGGAGTATVNGGILDGKGAINGPVTVASGGTLMAGTLASPGTLTINNALTLNAGGNCMLRISKTGGTLSGDLLQGMTTVTYGGTLTVTNVTSDGTLFAVGDTLQLFNSLSYSGSFASVQGLPALSNPSWSWDLTQLPVNGSIRVINGTGTPSFNPPGGGYVGAQTVTITSDTGSTVIYTTDGSNPTTSPTAVSGASPLSGIVVPVGVTETIKAYATNVTTSPSLVASATYTTVSTAVWTNAAGGSWPNPANWNLDAVGNGAGVTADFSTLTLATNPLVTVSTPETVGTLLFGDQGNAYGWTVNGSVLTLNAGNIAAGIAVNNQQTAIGSVLAGTNGLVKTGAGTLALSGANSYSGTTVVSNGVLELTGNGGSLGTISNSAVTVESGAEVQAFAGDVLGYTYSPVRTLTLNGGTLREMSTNSETLGRPITMINGVITANPGAGNLGGSVLGDCYNLFNATAVVGTAPGTTNYITLPPACHFALRGGSFSNAANSYLIVNAILDGWGGSSSYSLITAGPGTMILNSNNTYTGSTIISNGTLEVDGSISNGQVLVYGTLDGRGGIGGDTEINPGGTLEAGTPAAIATLAINNTLELGGTAVLKISKTGGVATSDNIAAAEGVTYGGALTVTNVTSDSTAFASGDSFTLFTVPGASGGFATTNLPALPGGLAWNWNPAAGTLSVVSGVNLNPATANFQAVSASGSLQFTWAPDHLGWQLYTNSVGITAVNSWFPVPGSGSVTNEAITVNPANPNVFFQLRYP